MSEPYPVPAYAAHIWLAGDRLMLGLPPNHEGGKGHSVALPANEHALTVLVETLRERARSAGYRIGDRAEPTQYQLDLILAQMKRTAKEAVERAKAVEAARKAYKSSENDKLLADLGL